MPEIGKIKAQLVITYLGKPVLCRNRYKNRTIMYVCSAIKFWLKFDFYFVQKIGTF